MPQPFIGEITMFAANFAPRGWALCDGQLLAISGNQALFALLGTIYGGDGRVTFALPELRGRIPIHTGSGPGLTPRPQGQRAGDETENIGLSNLPVHGHPTSQGLRALPENANDPNPAGNMLSQTPTVDVYLDDNSAADMHADAVTTDTGGKLTHNNAMPFLCVNFIIALQGTFPSRN